MYDTIGKIRCNTAVTLLTLWDFRFKPLGFYNHAQVSVKKTDSIKCTTDTATEEEPFTSAHPSPANVKNALFMGNVLN